MEIKINREIRDYTESIFFGLSARQFGFSLAAIGIAVLIYFLCRGFLGIETLSWLCILAAFPFAVLGFVKYHSMYAEELIWAYIKSEILMPRELGFSSEPIYMKILRGEKND